jgi:hypothetical protein
MAKSMPYILIMVLILITSSMVFGQRWYYNERPDEPSFPNVSNRVQALGEDFSGIITDLETDVLQNPSLVSLLESKSIGITFLPYKYYGSYFPPTLLTLLFPNFPVSKLALGFQNQFIYTKSGNYDVYSNYYNNYYSHQYNFYSYQQLFFLAFSPSEHFSLAPFYVFTKNPYQENYYSEYDYSTIYSNNNAYAQTSNETSQYDDNILYHRFGIGASFNYNTNSVQITAAYKKGDNKITFEGNGNDNTFNTYIYSYDYDSSYHFYQDHIYRNNIDIRDDQKTKKINELNVSLRWQKQIDDDNTFTSLLYLTKSIGDLTGTEFINSYESDIDSSLQRWRNYPYPESIEVEVDSDIKNDKDSSRLTGTTNSLNLTLGLGLEKRFTEKLRGFIGIKSILGIATDTSSKLGMGITAMDTITDTTGISGSQLIKSKSFSVALPLGLEFKLLPSLLIRAGFTPKFTYNKSGLTNHNQIENVKGLLIYSFGVGYTFKDEFSIDAFNRGNIGTFGDWNLQFKYMF